MGSNKEKTPFTRNELFFTLIWIAISILSTLSCFSFSSGYSSLGRILYKNDAIRYVLPWILLIVYRLLCFKYNNKVMNSWYSTAKIALCSLINISLFVIGASYGKDYRGHALIMTAANYALVSCASAFVTKAFDKYGSPKNISSLISGFVCIVISFSTYWQSMSGYRSYMKSTDYSSVAILSFVSVISIIVSIVTSIRNYAPSYNQTGNTISAGNPSQRSRIKKFQHAYKAKAEFEEKKIKIQKAYNLSLLLDMCETNGAKELLSKLLDSSNGNSHKKPLFSKNKIYSPNTENPFNPGEIFTFGHYAFEKNNVIKPIEWIILKTYPDSLLLVSKYALDRQPYTKDNNNKFTTWSSSYIRKWLNESFYNAAFSNDEKKMIAFAEVKTFPSIQTANSRTRPPVLDRYTDKEITSDYVFLPDIDEFEVMPNHFKFAQPTPYYQDKYYDYFTESTSGVPYSDRKKYVNSWLLRNLSISPRYSSWWYPTCVEKEVLTNNATTKEVSSPTSDLAIRPAILVSLKPVEAVFKKS